MKKNYSEEVGIFLRGLLMGTCDIIPGVSGGTIALITGIYERLINAIGSINPHIVFSTLRLDKAAFIEDLKQIDIGFLIVLVCGIGVAFALMARVITYLLHDFPQIMYAFFFGLILASSLYLLFDMQEKGYKQVLACIMGFVLGFLLVGFNSFEMGHTLPIIFLTGMAALCAMILPGISGAYITLLLGQYEYMLTAIHSFAIVEIVTFCAGGIVSLLAFTRVLKYVLKRYHATVLAVMIGFMLGTSRLLYIEVTKAGGFDMWAILAAIIGILVIALIAYLVQAQKNEIISTEE
jgi:putative membrane protein